MIETIIDGMVQALKDVDPKRSVRIHKHGTDSSVVYAIVKVDHQFGIMIAEDNATRRFAPRAGATWRWPDNSMLPEGLHFAVVFYGPAAFNGDVWEESKGEKDKNLYRRIMRISQIRMTEVRGMYHEIDTILSHETLKQAIDG